MTVPRVFPGAGVLRRPGLRLVDLVVGGALCGLLFALVRVAPALNGHFVAASAPASVSTDPALLPYYAFRSLLRMFLALGLSLVFTFVYATAAARVAAGREGAAPAAGHPAVGAGPRIPVGDGHAVHRPVPAQLLGLECASIFAIFTTQAWNMTFSFYQSLITLPRELDEAARLYAPGQWQRFRRLEVPRGVSDWSGTR